MLTHVKSISSYTYNLSNKLSNSFLSLNSCKQILTLNISIYFT